MLQKLSIQNYALIDNIEIELDKNLNIITGETGAGKSILLGALSLLLGQRADSKYFFSQTKKCIIEGQFLLSKEAFINQFLELDLDFEEITSIRREISIDGKSRAFINDTPVNLSTLKFITEKLIAIHTQNATTELNQPDFQFLIIDSLAQTASEYAQYQKQFKKLKLLQSELDQLTLQQAEDLKKQDYEEFILNELVGAALVKEEQSELENELNKLKHVESIKTGISNSVLLLNDQENSIQNLLKETLIQLHSIEKFDDNLSPYSQRINHAFIELKDISTDLEKLQDQYYAEPMRVAEISNRLNTIYSLQQKHRVGSIEELLEIQTQLESNSTLHEAKEKEIAKLKKDIQELRESTFVLADKLSHKRYKVLESASKSILEKLTPLQLPDAQLTFSITKNNELGKFGFDQIELLFTANRGQTLLPIHKIASGGELSRLMLAIKAVLAKHTSLATLIFDEIDTGISGEAAQKVANLLEELGDYMQLITITHLPQIASKGNSHYLVYKGIEENASHTYLMKLNNQDRIHTIAQMLSGENPTQAAITHAKELLKT